MAFFFQIEPLLSLKYAWLPPIFVWIPRALAKSYFLRIVLNRVGTTHRKPEYLEMRRTYAQ